MMPTNFANKCTMDVCEIFWVPLRAVDGNLVKTELVTSFVTEYI